MEFKNLLRFDVETGSSSDDFLPKFIYSSKGELCEVEQVAEIVEVLQNEIDDLRSKNALLRKALIDLAGLDIKKSNEPEFG